jgi:hypothetical protein
LTVQPDRRPDTIIRAEGELVLGLAAGAITIDQALSIASVQGDRHVRTTVFGGAPT